MTLLAQFTVLTRKIHYLLFANHSPQRISAGIVLGLIAGLTPPLTLQWVLLFMSLCLLRVPLLAPLLSCAVFSILAPLADPAFHALGLALLLDVPFLIPFWADIYHIRIFPFTSFNNSVTLGSAVFCTLAAFPLYFALLTLLRRRVVRDRAPGDSRGYFRWRALIPLTILVVGVVLGTKFYFDEFLRSYLERAASQVNGAPVKIRELKSSFLHPAIELKGIEVARLSLSNKNLFSIDLVSLNFILDSLLRKKIFVADMNVQGVHYNTLRTASGKPDAPDLVPVDTAPLQNRVAPMFFSGIRNTLTPNPLRTLDQLNKGMNLRGRISTILPKLEISARLRVLDERLSAIEKKWRATASVPKENTSELIREWESESGRFRADLDGAQALVAPEILSIKEKLNLPRLDYTDMSSHVFGVELAAFLERLAYWIDWSRRRMPQGTSNLVVQERTRGVSVHFAKPGVFPTFLLARANISSDARTEPGGGILSGELEGLTSDPSLYGRPFKLVLTADFPTETLRGVQAEVRIDHTGDSPVEKFRLKIEKMDAAGFESSSLGALGLRFTGGQASVDGEVDLTDGVMTATMRLGFKGITYDVKTPIRELEEALRRTLDPLSGFELQAALGGPLENLKLEMKSEFGAGLAKHLRESFSPALTATDDTLHQEISDEFETKKEALSQRLSSLQREFISPLYATVKDLREVAGTAEKNTVAPAPKTPGAAKRKRHKKNGP